MPDSNPSPRAPSQELGVELATELAEIGPSFGSEIEDQLRSVEDLFPAGQLDATTAVADLHHRDPLRLAFAVLVLQPRNDIVARGDANDVMRRVGRRPLPLHELRNRPHDGSDGRTVFGLDDDA